METLRVWFAKSAFVIETALLMSFCGGANASLKAAAPEFFQLTVEVSPMWPTSWAKEEGVLRITKFVKLDTYFCFSAEDSEENHMKVSGTVREEGPEHFFLDEAKLESSYFGPGGWCSVICDSEVTMNLRRWWDPTLPRNAAPVGEEYVGVVPVGPWHHAILKRATLPQLAITPRGGSVVVSWPTNIGAFRLESSTNLVSPTWTPLAADAPIINRQFTVTNPICGGQQFYRLSQ